MTKTKTPAIAGFLAAAPAAASLRVVDAKTGETIAQVIEADAVAGKVRRYAVEDGMLVRADNAFVIVEEDCEIRIEQIEGAATGDAEGEGEG